MPTMVQTKHALDGFDRDANDVIIPAGAIGVIDDDIVEPGYIDVILECNVYLPDITMSDVDIVHPFAGFEECENRTPGNILWNFMSCFELYSYAGRMLNYFYSIMERKAFYE